MGVAVTLVTLGLLLGMVTAQQAIPSFPIISEAVRNHVAEDPGGSVWSFVKLWEYSLDQDSSPYNRYLFGESLSSIVLFSLYKHNSLEPNFVLLSSYNRDVGLQPCGNHFFIYKFFYSFPFNSSVCTLADKRILSIRGTEL